MTSLTGNVAPGTGGARGICRAICKALAEAGAQGAVADLHEGDASDAAQAIGGTAVTMGVTNFDEIKAGMQSVEDALDGIDVFVNTAAIFNKDVVDPVIFLTSDTARYTAAQTLNVGAEIG